MAKLDNPSEAERVPRVYKWLGELLYDTMYGLASVVMGMGLPVRCSGANCVPKKGGFLLCANHQSYIDPPLLGLTCIHRRLGYLAKEPLFRFAPFRWFIVSLGAIKIDQVGSASSGMRATLRTVARGIPVALFPEGGRTEDGRFQPLKAGILLLVRKAKAPVVVAGIAGAYEAWPLTQLLPSFKPMWVHYTTWEWPEGADDRTALADLQRCMEETYAIAEHRWKNIGGRRRVQAASPAAPTGLSGTAFSRGIEDRTDARPIQSDLNGSNSGKSTPAEHLNAGERR